MDLQETIIRVLKENKLPLFIKRRLNFSEDEVINMLKKFVIRVFEPHKRIEAVIGKACADTAYELIDSFGSSMSDEEYYKLEDELRDFFYSKYFDFLKEYIYNYFDSSGDEYGTNYVFWKHEDRNGGNGFSNSFPTWNKLLMEYGWWFPDLDWEELKQKLDSMPDRVPLLIKKPNDKNNTMGYYFSLLKINKKPEMSEAKLRNTIKKFIREETNKEIIRPILRRLKNIDKLIKNTANFTLSYFSGKHFNESTVDEFVDRVVHNFYIDYVSPIFEKWDEEGELEPELLITTEDKKNLVDYFKNHYYETIAKYYRGMFPERINEEATDTEYAVIEILKPSSRMSQKWYFQAVPLNKTEHDKIYIKRGPAGILTVSTKNIKIHKVFKKSEKEEMDKYLEKLRDEDIKKREQNEGLQDTSWESGGEKVTLIDLLSATEDIPVKNISLRKLKPHLLGWDNDDEEFKKIEKANLKYPILIFVNDRGGFISIIDGHHRVHKAVRKGLKTIKGKVIPINTLPSKMRKVFGHMGKREQNEGEITERCWKGYTQKGMKTMFGKRYPNCVKKKLTESVLPIWFRRRFDKDELNDLVKDIKDQMEEGESRDTAIYDTIRQFIATKNFSDINEFGTEQEYWDSYLMYEKPLVHYVKKRLGYE